MCKEYQGPDKHYRRLGIKHLRLPTVDHFEPTVTDLEVRRYIIYNTIQFCMLYIAY